MDLQLDGKVALVAGGGRGIGRAVALALAREGARVAVLSRTESELDETCAAIAALGGRGLALPSDIANAGAVEAALSQIGAELGAPTIVVIAAAAHYEVQRFHTLAPELPERLLAVDLGGAVTLCRLAIPEMIGARYGRIVVMGSLAARVGMTGATLYATAKAGLEGLVRSIALDYGRRGITANVCNVGFADTERLRSRLPEGETVERFERATAIRRLTRPEEIADITTFLCSPRAASITGAVIDATGGAHLANAW